MPVEPSKLRPAGRAWLICALLGSNGFIATPILAQDTQPQERRVCVATAGGGWQCGSASNPPSAPESVPQAPPPPVFLADPRQAGQPGSPFAGAAEFRDDVVAVEPSGAPAPTQGFIPGISAPGGAPIRSAPPARATPPASPAASAAAPPPSPPPAVASPAPRPANPTQRPMVGITPAAEPVRSAPVPTSPASGEVPPTSAPRVTTAPDRVREDVAQPDATPLAPEVITQPETALVSSEPEHPEPGAVPPVEAPAHTEPPPAPQQSRPARDATTESTTRSTRQQAGDNEAFLRLDGGDYVLQLLSSSSRSEVLSAADRYNVDRATMYVLEIRRDGVAWWLLLWAPFPDADSARDALGRLAEPPAASVWPRRIAPLQNEARRVLR